MAVKQSILGISLSDKSLQAVEIEQDGNSNTLTAIDEWENSFATHKEDDGHGEEKFVDYLTAFMKVNRVKAKKISVALDTAQLVLNTIPLEDSLSRIELNEHMNWELSQYFPDTPPKEFITDVHVLTQHQTENWNEVLSVSVRRSDAYRVQRVVTKLGLDLHVLDVDHFSADTALRTNYPDTNRKYLALIGVKENRLDISLIKNGNMESYSYCAVQSDKEIVDQIATLARETKGIYSITVYGPYLDKDLLVQIRRASTMLIEALNPLRHVKVADSLRLAEHLTVPSYRFASAVGVALRRD
jgi:Tfp pilus assembly PilM family ATPase